MKKNRNKIIKELEVYIYLRMEDGPVKYRRRLNSSSREMEKSIGTQYVL